MDSLFVCFVFVFNHDNFVVRIQRSHVRISSHAIVAPCSKTYRKVACFLAHPIVFQMIARLHTLLVCLTFSEEKRSWITVSDELYPKPLFLRYLNPLIDTSSSSKALLYYSFLSRFDFTRLLFIVSSAAHQQH